jgi:signal transduction histidine kinase/CheY-like chemotaxis protein
MTTNLRRARSLSIGLLVVLVVGTVTGTLMLRNLVHDQNEQLLHERTSEAGLLLTSTISSIKPSLSVLGATYAVDPDGSAARLLTKQFAAGSQNVTAIIASEDDRLVVRVAGGPGIAENQSLTGARAELARRAIDAQDLVGDIVGRSESKGTQLAFAVALPTGIVVYQEMNLQASQLTTSGSDSPFSELEGAVYVGTKAEPASLLFANVEDLPLTGTVDREVLQVGADRWLLVASARNSLVGSFAAAAPWIVLALGLLFSVVACAAVDLLLRRRAYALALVEERTATLRRTMDDLEAASASAAAANQAKSEFLSRMSHELRTPLNAVLGFAQVLELGELTEPQRQSVTQIIKGGQHLLALINDILDIARIETGNLSLSAEPVLPAELVDDVLDLVEPLAAQRGIECGSVATDADGASTYVLADRQRLKQVLLNLVANAVKYNQPGGRVTITTELRGAARLRIKVTDTGPGIPPDRLARLFEPFERLGAEQTDVEGAGIGLALSRRLAEAMNGTVDVESTEGTGSTFWVELGTTEGPVERHQRTSPAAATAPAAVPQQPPRHTVLYVEDNLANIKLIEHVLNHRGDVQLMTAMQGRLGISLALQHHPALILLDLHLPDVGGETVLAGLRSDPATATTPVIVLTADATDGQRKRLLAAGATEYLTKPLDVRQLLEVIDEHLPSDVGAPTSTLAEPG